MLQNSDGLFIFDTSKKGRVKLTYGSFVVRGKAPTAKELEGRIRESSEALARATKVLGTPGVKLRIGSRVPRYSVDPANPDYIIQIVDGQKLRGVFKEGRFEAVRD